ncbi:MAG: hypothetical protein ACOCV2_01870 [Persicimonas sp.]
MTTGRTIFSALVLVFGVIGCETFASAVDDSTAETTASAAAAQLDKGDEGESTSSPSDDGSNIDTSPKTASTGAGSSGGDSGASGEDKQKLMMCQSNADATVGQLEELFEDDEIPDYDVEERLQRADKLEEKCLEGSTADRIEGLSGYDELESKHERAEELTQKYERQAKKEEKKEREETSVEGLGSDNDFKRQDRWKMRPKRCKDVDVWNKKEGVDKPDKGETAAITGADEMFGSDEAVSSRAFSNPGAGRSYPVVEPHSIFARYACGKGVQGVDGSPDPNLGNMNTQYFEDDPRVLIGEAANDRELSGAKRNLYKAATAHYCWYATVWDLENGYAMYLQCKDVADDLPSVSEVEEAMDEEYPDFDFGKANVAYTYERALEAKKEVEQAFTKLEEEYPRLKEVYVDSAEAAEREYEKRREKYADIYKELDPITDRLLEDPESTPPEGCTEKVKGFREELAEDIPPTDEASARRLRVGNPLGYQITEALVYCYLHDGELARGWVEADALDNATRRVTRAEHIYIARREALHEVEQEFDGDEDAIAEALPNYKMRHSHPFPLPGDTHHTPHYLELLRDAGLILRTLGGPDPNDKKDKEEPKKRESKAPIVERTEETSKGTRIVFVKKTDTITTQDLECKDTDQVESWEVKENRMVARFKQDCTPVGPKRTEEVEYQYDPRIVPKDQGAMLESGMRVELMLNEHPDAKPDDVVIKRAWSDDNSQRPPVIIDGIELD